MHVSPFWRRISTWGFALGFAHWVAAQRYTGSFSSGASPFGIAQPIMTAVIIVSALVLMFGWARSVRANGKISANAIVFFGALLLFELLWRFWRYDLPDNGFKLVATAAFLLQPLVALLGIVCLRPLMRSARDAPPA
jgi:hypothetical protein